MKLCDECPLQPPPEHPRDRAFNEWMRKERDKIEAKVKAITEG